MAQFKTKLTPEESTEILRQVIAEHFGIPVEQITPTTTLMQIGFDSLDGLQVPIEAEVALEKALGYEVTIPEAVSDQFLLPDTFQKVSEEFVKFVGGLSSP
jgi:acyl carrier protein